MKLRILCEKPLIISYRFGIPPFRFYAPADGVLKNSLPRRLPPSVLPVSPVCFARLFCLDKGVAVTYAGSLPITERGSIIAKLSRGPGPCGGQSAAFL